MAEIESRITSTPEVESPERYGVHNVAYTMNEEESMEVPPHLYIAEKRGTITYEVHIDDPVYPKVLLYHPDSWEEEANKKEEGES